MEVSIVTVIGSCATETASRSWIEVQEVYVNDDVADARGAELEAKYSEMNDGNDYKVDVDFCDVSYERLED